MKPNILCILKYLLVENGNIGMCRRLANEGTPVSSSLVMKPIRVEKGEFSSKEFQPVLFPLISLSLSSSNKCISFTLDFALMFVLKKKQHQTIQNMSYCFGNVGVNEY